MSWFVLMEMALVALMTIYLTYHTHLVFKHIRHAKIITLIIIVTLIILCQFSMLVFGFLANACICFVAFDLINLILFKTRFDRHFKFIYQRGIVTLIISLILSCYGIYNAKNTIVTSYDINIDKEFEDKTLLVVSDIHLSTAVDVNDLYKIKDQVDKIKPDALILLGDIYDEGTTQEDFDGSLKVFKEIAEDNLVYYIEGNHEIGFQGGCPLKELDVVDNLTDIGVHVLLDEVVELDDIYLIGRKDYVVSKRASLKSLVSNLDDDKPLVLLDHQPHEYDINKEQGIDLELSGHTHAGQIFPLQYLFDLVKVNDLNYGMITDGNFHAIVTSGMGTWGYAMRSAKHSEILQVNLISNK